MNVQMVFDHLESELNIPEVMGEPSEHQMCSTSLDNLVELCGRVCYDSLGTPKSRTSEAYHAHINEVNHGSVQEHATITLQFDCAQYNLLGLTFLNRPGTIVDRIGSETLLATANLRAIREWPQWNNTLVNNLYQDYVGDAFREIASKKAPLVFDNKDYSKRTYNNFRYKEGSLDQYIDRDILDRHIWISFYIGGISRGFSHEQVRHKYYTAVSQRSTRYVDESESDWALHPLLTANSDVYIGLQNHLSDKYGLTKLTYVDGFIRQSQIMYDDVCNYLQQYLIDQGINKFTARKQARGAARGFLGNALETQMIFSSNLEQWKRIILQRAHPAADAEIRLVYNTIYETLSERYPQSFKDWHIVECEEGIGYGVCQNSL